MAAKKGSAKRKSTKVGNGKKASSRKVSKTPSVMRAPSIKDPLTKGAILRTIAEMTGSSKKDTATFLEALTTIIQGHVKPQGPGKFVFPGLLKITVVKKAARPARKGINPFTGEETTFKAKPAHKVVKIKPLKPLKETVA